MLRVFWTIHLMSLRMARCQVMVLVGYSPTVYLKKTRLLSREQKTISIKEEKRYQNAIAKIRKSNRYVLCGRKEEREKQRQEYQEELQEAYEDYQDKINDVIGQNIEVSDSVKNIGDEYMNTADKAENAAQRMSDAMKNINWEERVKANNAQSHENGLQALNMSMIIQVF